MLKALMLRKKLEGKKAELESLRAKTADFEKREAELAQAIEEAATDEEKAVVEEEVNKFEAEKTENETESAKLEEEVAEIEKDLAEAEAEQQRAAAPVAKKEERGETKMITRKFFGMDAQERDAFFGNEQVKAFLSEVRTAIKEKRAISNVGLTIPQEMLPLIKQVVEETSKLIGKVNKVSVAGTARQTIMGSIPEAVWTEMCANLNELDLGFNDVEVDGYKVGGFFAVCNAVLEDNDVNLASEIITALGKSIGKALDKAIVYGTGTKMPLGFVTRLAQTVRPSGYPSTARAWVDLHETNITTGTGKSGVALFKEILEATKEIANDYASELVWIMNKSTHTQLMIESMDKNLNGAIVAGINGSMPVVGGEVVELQFMADGDIAFGYLDAYLLAERAGTQISSSEHAKFIEDRTVFKGTARYDGQPVIAEAFGLLSIGTTAPETTKTFPTDTAN